MWYSNAGLQGMHMAQAEALLVPGHLTHSVQMLVGCQNCPPAASLPAGQRLQAATHAGSGLHKLRYAVGSHDCSADAVWYCHAL